jgi:hypothetical protein
LNTFATCGLIKTPWLPVPLDDHLKFAEEAVELTWSGVVRVVYYLAIANHAALRAACAARHRRRCR